MRLQISSRKGHFNFANPSEESISTSIKVYDDNGEIVNYTSIKTDYEMDLSDIDQEAPGEYVADLIEDYQKRLWLSTSREKDLDFAKWLREHNEEIINGNRKYRIEQLKKEKEKIEKELKTLESLEK